MTHEELLKEIMQLPLKQRVELLATISRSLREELLTSGGSGAIPGKEPSEADEQSERERRLGAVERLRGILKTSGPPPSDEDLEDMRLE